MPRNRRIVCTASRLSLATFPATQVHDSSNDDWCSRSDASTCGPVIEALGCAARCAGLSSHDTTPPSRAPLISAEP